MLSANNFSGVEIKQGTLVTYSYTVNSTTNPSYTFTIPDNDVDTNTLQVTVQQSGSNTYYDIYLGKISGRYKHRRPSIRVQ